MDIWTRRLKKPGQIFSLFNIDFFHGNAKTLLDRIDRNAETFGDLTRHWGETAAGILGAMRHVPPETRRVLLQVLAALGSAGAANLRLLVPEKPAEPPKK